MNNVCPKNVDFLEIKDSETAFLKNLKKVKIKKINCAEPEVLEIGDIKLIPINKSKLEDFSATNIKNEELDLTNVNSMLGKTRTIKEILSTDISTPIAELFNIDITEQIQNTLESIVSMVSVSKN